MGTKLTIEYDEVADILYLDTAEPTENQLMSEVAPGMMLRQNTSTKTFDGIEIHGLRRRAGAGFALEMPVSIDLDELRPVSG